MTALKILLAAVTTLAAHRALAAKSRAPVAFADVTGDLPALAYVAVAVDDDVLYAGADGFVFQSVDGGVHWRCVLSFPRSLDVDDAERAFAMQIVVEGDAISVITNEARFVSRDRAKSFVQADVRVRVVDGFGDDVEVLAVATSPKSGTTFVGTSRGLFASTNEGAYEFVDAFGEARVSAISLDPETRDGIVVVANGVIRFSSDGGRTLDETSARPPGIATAVARGKHRSDLLVATARGIFRSSATDDVVDARTAASLAQSWSSDPAFSALARCALRSHGLDPVRVDDMEQRASIAHALPSVSVRFVAERGVVDDSKLVVAGVDTNPIALDPAGDTLTNARLSSVAPTTAAKWTALVLLTWNLDQLVHNDVLAEILRRQPLLESERERVVGEVGALFFERKRAQLSQADPMRRAEIDAQLAALTGTSP